MPTRTRKNPSIAARLIAACLASLLATSPLSTLGGALASERPDAIVVHRAACSAAIERCPHRYRESDFAEKRRESTAPPYVGGTLLRFTSDNRVSHAVSPPPVEEPITAHVGTEKAELTSPEECAEQAATLASGGFSFVTIPACDR